MSAVRHILVASDESEAAQAAAEYACTLASMLAARMTLLQVVSAPIVAMPDAVYTATPDEMRALDAKVEEHLRARAATLARPGLHLDIEVVEGSAADGILAAAQRLGADLIVIGTHGRRGIAHLVLGSVAEAVVRRATCPVLAVHAGDAVKARSAA